jgi:hypothetical protein
MDILTAKVIKKSANDMMEVGCNLITFQCIKNPTEVGIVFYSFMDLFFILLAKRTKTNANIAPVKLAKTSKKSPFRVVVNWSCKISMLIPNTIEKETATI